MADAGEADYLATGDKSGVLAIGRHGKTRVVTLTEMITTLRLEQASDGTYDCTRSAVR